MRLWHKQLIPVLPRLQLIAQWRELAAAAKDLREIGRTNHILINRIMDYPLDHFAAYGALVRQELLHRGFNVREEVWEKICSVCPEAGTVSLDKLFSGWHNDRYLLQCYANLQEKFDCGGIPHEEWVRVEEMVMEERQ